MSAPVPVAFYAPLKPPDHPVPSGDRRMAGLLLAALAQAGFAPFVASRLRTYDGAGDPAAQARLREEALAEAELLIGAFSALAAGRRPRLWFTYHLYYKAPDWIGPRVAGALSIPYVVAEASRAGKRALGPWRLGHAGVEMALDRAARIFVLNEADRAALGAAELSSRKLIALPPFVDIEEPALGGSGDGRRRGGATPLLLAVSMMRSGDKLASYRLLAEALTRLRDRPWRLAIVGDGEARAAVEDALAGLRERVDFRGLVEDRAELAALYARADVLVWPAVNEAYGMALLEAQAYGCPVVAGRYGGVPSVVRDGTTGLLTAPGNAAAFAAAVAALLDDPAGRERMGAAARTFVRGERTVAQAAGVLCRALMPLVAEAIM